MRVLVLVKANSDSEEGPPPDPQMLSDMKAFNDELRAAGAFVAAEGLAPTKAGQRIHYEGARKTTVKGPFLPPQEQVAGFWIWEVKDMAEAMAWAARCPKPMQDNCAIEIRPYFEL